MTEGRFKRTSSVWVFADKGKGTARVEGDRLVLRFDDGATREVPFAEVKRFSFNGINGLWAMRLRSGEKLVLQTTGALFSVGDRGQGHALNDAIGAGLVRHGATQLA